MSLFYKEFNNMNIAKYKIYVPEVKSSVINKKSLSIANVLFLELANYGLELDPVAFTRLIKLAPAATEKFAKAILAEYTIGQLNPPLFKNWEERTHFSYGERVVQILGYVFQFCGNDFENEAFMDNLKRNVDFTKAKKIELVSKEEFQEYFTNLIGANLTLDLKTSNKLKDIFSYFEDDLESLPRIKSAEIRIAALLTLSNNKDLNKLYKELKCNSLDVLRYAAAKNDFQLFKLPADVKYSNVSWAERVAGFKFLNDKAKKDLESVCEDMGLNRTAWTRYLKHTHFFGQDNFINRFHDLYVAAYVSVGSKYDNIKNKKLTKSIDKLINNDVVEFTQGGNLAYRTFASRMQTAIDNKNWKAIKKLAEGKENYIMRNLTTVSNGIKTADEPDFIKYLKKSVKDTDIGVLFSLLSINVDSKYRVMDVKGDTRIETAQYPEFFRKIQKEIRAFIKKQYGFSGKVNFSKELEDRIVPFLSKNSELERGTRIKIDKVNYAFFYVHWIEKSFRTDLDLSFIAFDANWKSEIVAYYAQANGYMTHSGDFTSAPAPNGATEYGRINFENVPRRIKYIAPVINCFTGNSFDTNKEVRAGFYTTNNIHFALNSEAIKYNVTEPAQMNIPFILDVESQEIIVIDYNRRERMGYIAANYTDDLKKVILATKSKNYISIGKLAEMLSGTGKTTALTITNNADTNNKQISPENLFSLFSAKPEKKMVKRRKVKA